MKNQIADLRTVTDVKQKNVQIKYINAEVLNLSPQSDENNVNFPDELITI